MEGFLYPQALRSIINEAMRMLMDLNTHYQTVKCMLILVYYMSNNKWSLTKTEKPFPFCFPTNRANFQRQSHTTQSRGNTISKIKTPFTLRAICRHLHSAATGRRILSCKNRFECNSWPLSSSALSGLKPCNAAALYADINHFPCPSLRCFFCVCVTAVRQVISCITCNPTVRIHKKGKTHTHTHRPTRDNLIHSSFAHY